MIGTIKLKMAYLIQSLIVIIVVTFKSYHCSTIFSKSESVFNNQKDIIEIALPQGTTDHVPTESWESSIKEYHSRNRRSATDGDTHSRLPFRTEIDLKDDHTNAMISWAGKTPDVVALTKTSGGSKRSNLYVSTNYGQNFTNVVVDGWTCLCTTVRGERKSASIDNLYHASTVQDSPISATSYMFTDKISQLIIYTRNLRDFTTVHVDFQPIGIAFHPVREDVVVAYGTTNSTFGRPINNLYISYHFGSEWSLVKSNVQDFQWGWQSDQMFVSVPSYLGLSRAASLYDVKELTYDVGIQEKLVIAGVHGFQLEGSFMFATKGASFLSASELTLHVSKNGSAFARARFPVIANYSNKEYYIVDADEDRVMVCVVHDKKSTHLYVSDTTGTEYTLSLPNIVYVSPASVGSTALPGLRFYAEPFADIHKVEGLRGIYIASQFLSNSSTDLSLADMNQTTRITYDKGGEWTHITAPVSDMAKAHTHCFWYTGCTLHLLQDFLFGNNYRAAGLLSSANAIGLVIGSGVMGYTLKQDFNPSIFMSTDAGFNWKEVARGNFTYNFGDHGNLIVMVPSRKLTKTLLYSHDEGETWNEYIFTSGYQLIVYGLLTEPGSRSGNFSLWGSKPGGSHSWVIVHVNLRNIFPGTCGSSDYKHWSPGVNVTSKEICLLGEQEVVERKIPSSFCYNGKEYERLQFSKNCKCIRSDYECDYGYIRMNETEDLWNPRPSIHFTTDIECVRDPDVVNITNQKPDFCPYGTSYEVTKGYRKIPGDVCSGGDDHLYDKVHRHCPNNNKTDFLIYSAGVNIYKYDLATQQREFLVKGSTISEIYSIEFDYNRDILYWADQDTDSVMVYNISDPYPTPRVLITENLGKIESLSLDWESDNLYLLDSREPKIEIFTVLTHWRRTIVQNNATHPSILENPRALDIFPLHGMMFWTDWSVTSPRVMKAGMSGLNPTTVITGKEHSLLYWPNGLAVDFDKEQIYIIDGFTHSLIVCGFDGSNPRSMLTDSAKIRHPFSLSLLKDRLYWSDWTDFQIKSVYSDKDQADGYYVVVSSINRIMSVKAMNWDKQYQGNETGCGMSNGTNGGCSNICVPSAHPNITVSTHRYCLCSEEAKPLSYINASNEHCVCLPGETFNVVSGYCQPKPDSSCASGQFSCSSGTRCIDSSWKCDRDPDCPDSSDEYNCPSQLCEANEFLCKVSQRCISKDWLCDGDDDCGDMSDEDERQHCNGTCSADKFQCANKICIPQSYKCDGENDCGIGDTSDEVDCETVTVTCSADQFHCNSSKFGLSCIPEYWKCDNEFDCDDRSDEAGCDPGGEVCNQYEFGCAFNASKCIPRNWLCDGDNDCDDNSDERNCTTTLPHTTTEYPSSSLNCLCYNDGRCVSYDAQCDGVVDCPNSYDEWWCSLPTTTSSSRPCNGFRCSDGLCLAYSQICDGTRDCHSTNEDEENCQCAADQVRCAINKNQCINNSQLCDGKEDCFGATDEEGCRNATAPTQCVGTFQCQRSKICINMWRLCDDHWDCMDGSDEANCNFDITVSGLNRTSVTNTTASFRWISSPVRSGLDVKYIIQYIYVTDIRTHQMNTSQWINGTVTSNTSGTVVGLEPYTNYMFVARALVTTENKESMGLPSEIVKLSTKESAPGPVNHIAAKVDGNAFEPGYWVFSWHYPIHPRGHIFKYYYNITADGIPYTNGEKEAKGTQPVEMRTYIHVFGSQMTITVWAINGAGEGEKASKTHCLELTAPAVRCTTSTSNSITLAVQPNQDEASFQSYEYSFRINYQDIDAIPRTQMIAMDPKLENYNVTLSNLAADRRYDISIEVERWSLYASEEDLPSCISTIERAECNTTGLAVEAVTGLVFNSSKASAPKLTWKKVNGTTVYQVVLSKEKAKLEEAKYLRTFNSSTNELEITGLLSCEIYFVAVRVKLPYAGPLSEMKLIVTDTDYSGPPRRVRISSPDGDGLNALLYPWEYVSHGDTVDVNISWVPACHGAKAGHTVYVTGDDDVMITPREVSSGINFVIIPLQRGGSYHVVIWNGYMNGKNSSALHFSPAPYDAPEFVLHMNDNTTEEIMYTMLNFNKDILLPFKYFDQPQAIFINIQYKADDGEFIDLGNDFKLKSDGSCNFTALNSSVHKYTVRIRYVRKYNSNDYFGRFGTSWIGIKDVDIVDNGDIVDNVVPVDAVPFTDKKGNGPIGMYIGISVSIVIVLVLALVLSVWCIRHRRLQRSFLDFTSSHYNTRTDNATFNTDDDSPMIQGFSDDEPLVIA